MIAQRRTRTLQYPLKQADKNKFYEENAAATVESEALQYTLQARSISSYPFDAPGNILHGETDGYRRLGFPHTSTQKGCQARSPVPQEKGLSRLWFDMWSNQHLLSMSRRLHVSQYHLPSRISDPRFARKSRVTGVLLIMSTSSANISITVGYEL